jgi:hypothetical protein
MGTWESFKAYPWACFWAFLMCFTIVSRPVFCTIQRGDFAAMTGRLGRCSLALEARKWNRTWDSLSF